MANKNIKIQQNNGGGYDTLFPHTLGGIVELTGYTVPASTSAISEDDSVNTAIGKLEKGLDGKVDDSSVVTTLGVDNTTIPTSKAVSDAIAGSGSGVPTGGTAGQILAKKTSTNYDTEWVDDSGSEDDRYVLVRNGRWI